MQELLTEKALLRLKNRVISPLQKFQVTLMWHFITQNYTKPKQPWIKATSHSNQFSGNQTYLLAIVGLMLYSASLQYGGGTDAP